MDIMKGHIGPDGPHVTTRTGVFAQGSDQSLQESVIGQAYGELERNLSELSECVNVLQTKLAPILGPDLAVAGSNGAEKQAPGASRFTESIRSDSARVRDLIEQVGILIKRVEV